MLRVIVLAFSVTGTALLATPPAVAADCPDNPQALGTTRTLTVNPRTYPMVGRAQYRESLRLTKREVVLTFDNGPGYPYTETILKTLAAECVKATFFALGSNVVEDPEQIRRVAAEGHSIGVQTFNHVSLRSLPFAEAKKEIDEGLKALNDAFDSPRRMTSFFRAPMLQLSTPLARYVVSLGMMVWSIDVDSRDWNDAAEEQIVLETMRGLQRTGGGIVAMQDVLPTTARALPRLLQELKRRNFRIVHVIPSQPVANAFPRTTSQSLTRN
ncbi:MAG: polysaccharide deacetylase family protein [Hyphomicrobiales bacterium]|nr:polysaccharide deacetylase family protein [Hyphomicrobiales bacterium]